MDELLDSSYRERIESLKDEEDFEAIGDAEFLEHPDDDARLLWAFYRPSGSHPSQVADKNVNVAIMAFNHSRLQPLERFTTLNPDVVADPALRIKIQNRSRMLFRALADEDLSELIDVLKLYPVYTDLACDQLKNGRKYYNKPCTFAVLTKLLGMLGDEADEKVLEALFTKLRLPETKEDIKPIVAELLESGADGRIVAYYREKLTEWVAACDLHPLQKSVLEKEIGKLDG